MMKGLAVVFLCGMVTLATAYPSCICTLELLPLCASNGATYANTCTFECEKQKSNTNGITFFKS